MGVRQLLRHDVSDMRPERFSGMKKTKKERHYADNFI